MKILSHLIRHSPGLLVVAVVTGTVSGFASAGLMALVNRTLALSARQSAPDSFAWAFVGVTATVLLSNLTSRLTLLRLSTRTVLRMRLQLSRQILAAPLRLVENHGSPRLMAALTEDILAISDTLAKLPVLFINLAIIAACSAYLLWLSWSLALGFIGVFAFGVFTYRIIEGRTREYLRQGREKWDDLVGIYQALILGNKELKLHGSRRRSFFAEEVQPTATAMQTLSLRWHNLFALAAAYGQLVYFALIGLILLVAPRLASFELPVLTGFTLLAIYINGPISFIVGSLPSFQKADVSLAKIQSLGLSLATTVDPEGDRTLELAPARSFRQVEVRGLTYVHQQPDEDKAFTLGPVDLKLPAGQLVFITGGNGSGKSSFARLLTGLYLPSEGTLLIDGQVVSDANRDHYRQHFAVVFSDFHLFDALFGLLTEDLQERAVHYLEKLGLTGKVRIVDGRFSTTRLSQGQRKRLALLTAFLEDRPIYLFDEWAADQDPAFKEVFYRQILPELKLRGRTVLAISHDEQYYGVADRIIRFDEGLVVFDSDEAPRREAVV